MAILKPFVFILFSWLILISSAWGMDDQNDGKKLSSFPAKRHFSSPDDFQEIAEKVLPKGTLIYSPQEKKLILPYEVLENKFFPILHKDVKPLFESYFSIMFDPRFPLPKHSNEKTV